MSLFRRNNHLNDAALLLLLEGDLRGRIRQHAEQHLGTCTRCCARRDALMDASLRISQEVPSPDPARASSARDRLAAGLAQQAQLARMGWGARLRRSYLCRPSVLLRAGMVLALLAAAVTWRQLDLPSRDRLAAYEETGPEPNHVLTPGAANIVSLDALCGLSDFDLDPRVSPEKARAVFRAYGLNERAARAYQVDYLINPQLGGNDQLENLWPEPYHATVWNARAKDALEARLHGMVCSGQLGLQAAQFELSTDWVAAYKKYFHTRRPVSTVAELDRPRTPEEPLR